MAIDPITAAVSLIGNFLLGAGTGPQTQERKSFGTGANTALQQDLQRQIQSALAASQAREGAPIEIPGAPSIESIIGPANIPGLQGTVGIFPGIQEFGAAQTFGGVPTPTPQLPTGPDGGDGLPPFGTPGNPFIGERPPFFGGDVPPDQPPGFGEEERERRGGGPGDAERGVEGGPGRGDRSTAFLEILNLVRQLGAPTIPGVAPPSVAV